MFMRGNEMIGMQSGDRAVAGKQLKTRSYLDFRREPPLFFESAISFNA
jgi:hypothetical protein